MSLLAIAACRQSPSTIAVLGERRWGKYTEYQGKQYWMADTFMIGIDDGSQEVKDMIAALQEHGLQLSGQIMTGTKTIEGRKTDEAYIRSLLLSRPEWARRLAPPSSRAK
jgi:hypothetical protein